MSKITHLHKYISKPYKLGKCDCFRLVADHLADIGAELPKSFKGQTLDTYAELYRKDPRRARKIMLRLLDRLCCEVGPHESIPGDVMFLRHEKRAAFLGINSGNGTVLVINETLPATIRPLWPYKIIKVWRWQAR